MISVEFLERLAWPDGGKEVPAAKFIFQGKHFLKDKDVMPLFHWTKDDVWRVRTGCTQVVYAHWLEAEAIYQYNPSDQLFPWNRTSKLYLIPFEAWVPVESLLMGIANYVSAKRLDAKIDWLEIKGVDLLRSRANQLDLNRSWTSGS